jgi:hypothetical protein
MPSKAGGTGGRKMPYPQALKKYFPALNPSGPSIFSRKYQFQVVIPMLGLFEG